MFQKLVLVVLVVSGVSCGKTNRQYCEEYADKRIACGDSANKFAGQIVKLACPGYDSVKTDCSKVFECHLQTFKCDGSNKAAEDACGTCQ